MNKVKNTQKYLHHLQNTSPGKHSFSFQKTNRFVQPKSFSPGKFYDRPSTRSKRITSLGYGEKSNFVNKETIDPGSYETRDNIHLDKRKGKSLSAANRQKFYKRIYQNGNPGPGQYNLSHKKDSKFYFGKSKKLPDSKFSHKLGPQTYTIKAINLEKISRFQTIRSIRFRTEVQEKSDKFDNKVPGPGSYNSQTIFKQQIRRSQSNTFGKQKKLKSLKPKTSLGPGQYKIFSVFGGGDQG